MRNIIPFIKSARENISFVNRSRWNPCAVILTSCWELSTYELIVWHWRINERTSYLQTHYMTLMNKRTNERMNERTNDRTEVRPNVTSGFFHTAASRAITVTNFRTLVIIGLFESVRCTEPVRDGRESSNWRDPTRERSDRVVYAKFPDSRVWLHRGPFGSHSRN